MEWGDGGVGVGLVLELRLVGVVPGHSGSLDPNVVCICLIHTGFCSLFMALVQNVRARAYSSPCNLHLHMHLLPILPDQIVRLTTAASHLSIAARVCRPILITNGRRPQPLRPRSIRTKTRRHLHLDLPMHCIAAPLALGVHPRPAMPSKSLPSR